jgi:hypothetical protein
MSHHTSLSPVLGDCTPPVAPLRLLMFPL